VGRGQKLHSAKCVSPRRMTFYYCFFSSSLFLVSQSHLSFGLQRLVIYIHIHDIIHCSFNSPKCTQGKVDVARYKNLQSKTTRKAKTGTRRRAPTHSHYCRWSSRTLLTKIKTEAAASRHRGTMLEEKGRRSSWIQPDLEKE
jgi:hypothetical protein